MARVPEYRAPVPESKFDRSAQLSTTVMSQKEYTDLLIAAREKGKLPEFYKWQRARKIILKG